MTLSLVAVFIPVLFMGGVVGRMFNEFGLVISMAILISGFVSLTLTPMLCSRILKPIDHHEKHNFLLRSFEWSFNRVTAGYRWALLRTVRDAAPGAAITLGTFVLTAILFQTIPKGFFPSEDIGQLSGLDRRTGRCLVRRHGGSPERGRGDHQARSRRRRR